MWWTDPYGPRARAALIGMTVAGALGACSTVGPTADRAALPLTPTEQYSVVVQQVPDQLALNPHAEGLSAAQRAAIAAFAARWRDSGRPDVSVHTPAGGPAAAVERTAADLVAALREAGVPAERLRVGPYDAAGATNAPVLTSFQRYEARGPDCEGGWDNLSGSMKNGPTAHFGCAVTANFASMIADPRDLISPAEGDPGDAARRANVINRYRSGQITSTAQDSQAVGSVTGQ